MKSYMYRNFRVDLHPYAGGYKGYVFPPVDGCHAIEPELVVAAPDGAEATSLEAILRDARQMIDDLCRQHSGA